MKRNGDTKNKSEQCEKRRKRRKAKGKKNSNSESCKRDEEIKNEGDKNKLK